MTDLGTLRELAEALLRYDAVTFLQLLDTLRLSEGRAAVWLLHSAAHTIFDYVCRSCMKFVSSMSCISADSQVCTCKAQPVALCASADILVQQSLRSAGKEAGVCSTAGSGSISRVDCYRLALL